MRIVLLCSAWLLAALLISSPVSAQRRGNRRWRGTSEAGQCNRYPGAPALAMGSYSGVVTAIENRTYTAPSGISVAGVHLLVESPELGVIDLHLGPLFYLKDFMAGVTKGSWISYRAFQNGRLADDHYVAVEITVNGSTLTLRDDDLKPLWRGRRALSPNARALMEKRRTRRNPAQ